ncbi:alpha/beta fold hydrolase [Naasia aerilata]|uniref:3-oxoadipate enol-lactonase n=1 Tax=Naasia aerilata TaxID=1162966 RepID=A0ABN6XUF0_9MICO|nr:alpha/beta fold hydrolase [Naasia aerilata]BDZ47003.1 3-oxoadipate enol-lactonase [Naasia aerilata]
MPALTATPLGGAADATVLLLLPSLGGSYEDWRPAAALLAERWRVFGVDLPGHGASAIAEEPFTIADLAQGVLDVVDELDVDDFGVVGTSLGGAVVQELALADPEGLVFTGVVCAAPRMGDRDSWQERAAAVRRRGTGSLVGSLAERWFTPGFATAHPEVVGRVLAGVAATDDESYALCCEALGEWDARERILAISVPVLAVRGENDPTATEEAMRPLLRAPGVTERVIPRVRHQAAIEAPDAVAAALLGG